VKIDKKITNKFLEGSREIFELLMQRKDGTHFESNVTANIIKISGETFIQAVMRDVSERKKIEAERLRTQKIESLALLAGGIAHDFNNILVGILGNVNLLQMEENLDSEYIDYLKDIEKATLQASKLTKQLLTFSKGGAPLKKFHNVSNILQESISFVMRGSKSKCILDEEKNLPLVEVDAGQMNQVFNNLLINANQAMDSGGIISISLKIINLLNSLKIPLPNGHYIQIFIKDHGGGIPLNVQDHIFEPYFTTKEKGSGLGLATAYSIMKRHGGYITFETTVGIGTTFFLYLPINEKSLENQNRNQKQKSLMKNIFSGKVIIMDDDLVVLKTLSKILIKFGLMVHQANDGKELIDMYRSSLIANEKYDLVIMDLTIPGGFGGKESITKLLEMDPNIKAIVSSGYSNDPIIANYKEYGFCQVLNKPYTIGAIKLMLSEFLQ
jgi:signal transduction histidine kinase/CheY-like chemotaxis protein